MIWVPSDTEAWEPAYVIQSDSTSVQVKTLSNKELRLPKIANNYDSVTLSSLEEDCENLVNLESFCEGIILHHVRKRFRINKIYTSVGSILVAINPYKTVDIYGPKVVDLIYEKTKKNEVTPPHVFSIGAAAVHRMRLDAKDQSVLISGESGAGKTEATKKILQLVSTISGSTASRLGASIENQILDSNPLLESFGNAKTIRNNNSSRFGKYMEVNFDKKFNIKGCIIISYLLEKSRVVKQGPGERNYHIFYMLLAGANKEMKTDFQLRPVDQFYYLSQSGCTEVDKRSDFKEFEDLLFAFSSLAIGYDTQREVFQCLAGILHLGNLTFSPSREVEGGSKINSIPDCRRVAALFGMDPVGLETALCCKDSIVNGELLPIPLSPEKATDQRDTLAKYIYSKVFDHIVMRVNNSLFRGKPATNIGVLDIFGFEVFTLNSFEQLCINYCNERLQTFFNEIIFEGEMKLYAEEGLPCDDITYQDNMQCVRLIDLRGAGIFAYLDEESVVPKGSDEKLVTKLNQIFNENRTTKSPFYGRGRKSPLEFIVHHFAGDVIYNSTDFLEKNKDSMAEGLLKQIESSKVPILKAAAGLDTDGKGNKQKSTKQTLSTKFKSDLDTLMTTLRATTPHFVRCIKPNNEQKSDKFDSSVVLNQLKYSGLFEAIRIRKAGYAVRMPYQQFLKRYKLCITGSVPATIKPDAKAFSEYILANLHDKVMTLIAKKHFEKSKGKPNSLPAADAVENKRQWVVGRTKVFIRTQEYKYFLDELRVQSTGNAAANIQKLIRGYLMRKKFRDIMGDRLAAMEAQRREEAYERKLMRVEEGISATVEQAWRDDYDLQQRLETARRNRIIEERKRVEKLKHESAIKIQRMVRGKVYRKRGRIQMCEKMLETAIMRREEDLLQKAMAMPSVMNVTSKLIRIYQRSCKELILAVLNESYVNNQLLEAMEVGSADLLKQAIRLADKSHMDYLSNYSAAKVALHNAQVLKSVSGLLASVLSKCVTVPKLLASVDKLQILVKEATAMGLAGEVSVQEAAMRMTKIRSLIILRDKLRFSVEICSPSKMKRAMVERSKLLRIYGPELCQEEAVAVEGMLRMLFYQKNVRSQFPFENGELKTLDEAFENLTCEEFDDVASEIASTADNQESLQDYTSSGVKFENATKQTQEKAIYSGETDVYLPPFVGRLLEQMRSAKTLHGLNEAIEDLVKVVPSEQKRKFYIRIFKWVVAFATWKYGEKKLHLTALNGVSHSAELGRVDTSESMERLDSSIEKIDQDYDSDENLRKDSPGRAKPSKSSAHTIISASSPSKSTYRKHYALERHSPENFLKGSGASSMFGVKAKRTGKYSPDKFYSRLTHRTQLSMDNEFVKERNSTDAEDKFYKLAGPSMGIGNNPFVHSEVKRSKSPVKFSDETTNAPTGPIDLAALSSRSGKSPQILKKSDVLHSQREIDTYSPECKSVYEMSIAGASLSGRLSPSAFGNISELQSTIGPYGTTIAGSPPKQAVHIPFAQRQSKSQVAAFEMLKKGKKISFGNHTHRTDQLFHKTIAEYDKKAIKDFRPASTF